jgi:predicted permease
MRWLNLFRKSRLDQQLDEEFEFHLDLLTERFVKQGMPRSQAEREARRQFGGVERAKEAYRDQRGVAWFEDLMMDLRHGGRLLQRNPAFAIVAILTMALGIGANSAVFSMLNAAFIRQVPYPNASRLVDICREIAGEPQMSNHNSRRYLYFKQRTQLLEEVAAVSGYGGPSNLIQGGEAHPLVTQSVSANFFRTLGIEPFLGRSFTNEEEAPSAPNLAILRYGLWQQRFAANPAVLGQTINLDGRQFTVIGVMPEHFVPIPSAQLWVNHRPRPVNDGRNTWVIGLLKPGVTRVQASQEMAQLFANYRKDYPGEWREFSDRESAAVARFGLAQRYFSRPLWILFGGVALILLIACSNLANLMIARASGRVREIATRAAIGAGRSRLTRQLLAESLLISTAGAALGLLLARWTIPLLVRISPAPLPSWSAVRVDLTVLGFTTVLAVFTGILFGIFPALHVSRMDLNDCLKSSGHHSTSKRATGRLRGAIVAAEVAFSLILLIGAGLFIRTFVALVGTQTGVDSSGVVAGTMSLRSKEYRTTVKASQFLHRGLERLREHPDIESAAVSNNLPMDRGMNVVFSFTDAYEPKLTDWRYVSSDYFRLLRIPLIAGRLFADADDARAQHVAIVNQRFVSQYFHEKNPVGHVIEVPKFAAEQRWPCVIVGVVGDVKSGNFREAAKATVFVPVEQVPDGMIGGAQWFIRTRVPLQRAGEFMQQQLKAIDPLVPLTAFRALEELREQAVRNDRSMMILLVTFAGLAVLLAAVGIYGVISYLVTQRTNEIGIRLALGASIAQLVRSVVAHGIGLAGAGIMLGIPGALLLRRFLQAAVFGVETTDPLTFAMSAYFLIMVAAIACLVPAMRITRMDPARALRVE